MKPMATEYVILVDDNDNEKALMEKIEAHEKGLLHRAFSVFLFNSQNEFLLQQRAFSKYHTPGLWTNTCCSHPRSGESVLEAAQRRLMEEMGMKCSVNEIFTFVYKAEVGQGLTEHEFDHVLAGFTDSLPAPNPDEVAAWKFISLSELKQQMLDQPEQFTVWFRIAFDQVENFICSKGFSNLG